MHSLHNKGRNFLLNFSVSVQNSGCVSCPTGSTYYVCSTLAVQFLLKSSYKTYSAFLPLKSALTRYVQVTHRSLHPIYSLLLVELNTSLHSALQLRQQQEVLLPLDRKSVV